MHGGLADGPQPSKITPPDQQLSPWRLIRTVVRNPIEAWPKPVYEQPLYRSRFLGWETVFVMDPTWSSWCWSTKPTRAPARVKRARVIFSALYTRCFLYRPLTMLRFSVPNRLACKGMFMARTAAPERTNPFLTRCNLQPSTPLHEVADPAVSKPELAFRIAADDLLGAVAEAIARIEHGDGADVPLRELWAALLQLKALVARDPGIRMAADDLYAAATALVSAKSSGSAVGDVRRWRLLREAEARLRDRLASAQPSEKARSSGLH
jgi:hypothetical protein